MDLTQNRLPHCFATPFMLALALLPVRLALLGCGGVLELLAEIAGNTFFGKDLEELAVNGLDPTLGIDVAHQGLKEDMHVAIIINLTDAAARAGVDAHGQLEIKGLGYGHSSDAVARLRTVKRHPPFKQAPWIWTMPEKHRGDVGAWHGTLWQ